jgi:hypothetical protein
MRVSLKLLRVPTDKDKLAPQARVIVEVLNAEYGKGKAVPRQELIDKIVASGKLETRQEPGRILSFYQPKLVEDGFIEVDKIEEPKAEKPAKEKTQKPSAPGAKATK